MFRSVAAVLAGYLVFGLSAALLFGLSGVDPRRPPSPAFLVFSVAYGAGFALLGGYVAARIAGRRPLRHAALVALLLAAIAGASLLAKRGTASVWSEVSVIALMAPAALAGGLLRRWQRR